ncbi:MAG: 2-C-methyl-D-erythritol 4-phosphate cytidylyltransferase [Bacteroidales bacterium]|nr:2-C-methyl-D-erythritol 4-phosphate cytidylyltransferase [Bacteroidales bacterium]
MKNVAILMAAGKGTRMGSEVPKQFVAVNGKMLMEYSLQVFQDHPRINEIVVVLPPDYLEVQEMLEYLFNYYDKVTQVLAGGNERFESSWAAIQWFVEHRDDNLLLHDAARPGITPRIIDDILDALQHDQAAVTAMPATDTILRVDENGNLTETLRRSELFYAQTPQAFRAGLLYDCFIDLIEKEDGFIPTDESGVVAHYRPEVPIKIVQGDSRNFKVTYAEDVKRLQQ